MVYYLLIPILDPLALFYCPRQTHPPALLRHTNTPSHSFAPSLSVTEMWVCWTVTVFSCVSLKVPEERSGDSQPIQSTWAKRSHRFKAQLALCSLSSGLIPTSVCTLCFCLTSVVLWLHSTLHLTMPTHSHLHY